MADSNNNHPKPLAFTETAGGSSLRRAVYRSGELWRYCVALAEAGKTPNADFMYKQYLSDGDIVVIDDNTLVLEREEVAPITEIPSELGFGDEEMVLRALRTIGVTAHDITDDDDDDQ